MQDKTMHDYHKDLDAALNDGFLRKTLDKFAVEYRASRDRVFTEIEERALIRKIADTKDAAARNMEALYEQFKAEAEKRGVIVHRALDAREANEIIARIARENNVRKVIKSKSMTAEETHLNKRLEADGLIVDETDLGEWIIQLRKEGPSHMVMPAIHLSRYQVADEFEKATGQKQDREDIQKMVKVARVQLRRKFIQADMGISGANFCVAETGSIAIVTNEGNGRMTNTLPRVHVAIAGLDKLIPTLDDVLSTLLVLPRNATSQRLTSYATFICGANECLPNPDKRKIMHIVFLDNGRSDIAKDPLFSQVYRCVRCGACANVCPVFRLVGGHKMGHVYIGAIGLVLTYLFHDREVAKVLCQNCVGCGSCSSVCSGGIDLPHMIQEIRARFNQEDGSPVASTLVAKAMKDRGVFHKLLKFMRFSQAPAKGQNGFVRHLPEAILGRHGFKSLPVLAPRAFREKWEQLQYTLPNPRLRVALFAGCAQDFVYPEQLEAAIRIFKAMNVQVVFPMEQTCCGLPLTMMGEARTAKDVALQNIAAFEGEYDYVVTLCASCASHLKHGYPNLVGSKSSRFSVKVIDFSSFVHDVLGMTEADFNKSGESVTYHASCHLCRGLDVHTAPRELIAAAADYVPCEEEEVCCGFGGTFSAKFPEISAELLGNKLENVKKTGAGRLVLDCPGCAMQLKGGVHKQGMNVRVTHIAELLAENLKK